MSAEDSIPDEKSTKSASASAPKARRISTPRPKKTAKAAKVDVEEKPVPIAQEPVAQPEAIVSEPVAPEPASSEPQAGDDTDSSAPSEDWPDAATTSGGPQTPGEGTKRKRRRRKGKGQHAGNAQQEESAAPGESTPEAGSPRPQQQPRPPQQQPFPQNQQRPAVKPDLVAKKAWKIFLAEVSEEGVALISDQDARDLSKRCFRLAEIFIEDQNRRR
jgi:hypothetical protein